MANRYEYEFKTFKSGKRKGQEYVNIRSTKTGKVIHTYSSNKRLKSAKKSYKQQIRRKTQKEINKKLKKIAESTGSNYEDLKKRYDKEIAQQTKKEKERIKRLKKEGKKPTGKKPETIKKEVLKALIKETGYLTTYSWFFTASINYQSPEIFSQRAGRYLSDEFDNMVEWVKDAYKRVTNKMKEYQHAAFADNWGACVRLIDLESDRIVRKFEMGRGCRRRQ